MELLAVENYFSVLATFLPLIAFYGWGVLVLGGAKQTACAAFPFFALISGWGIFALLSAMSAVAEFELRASTAVLLGLGWIAAIRFLIKHHRTRL